MAPTTEDPIKVNQNVRFVRNDNLEKRGHQLDDDFSKKPFINEKLLKVSNILTDM